MGDKHDIDNQQLPVEDRNRFILGHFIHIWQGRVSEDTLYQHVLNIKHFANNYLNYSAESDKIRSVNQAAAWDVYDFLTDWLPRKSQVDSAHRAKSYLASFNKLFKFMAEYMAICRPRKPQRSCKGSRRNVRR